MATIEKLIPTYRITLDGKDMTPAIDPRLIQLNLSENRSDEADQLDITLRSDPELAIPRRGIILSLSLGFKGDALIDKGSFIMDEVSHSGPPDQLVLRGRSAELTSSLRRRREQSWHANTLGDIVKTIVSRNQLEARIDTTLAAQSIGHIDQSRESDIAFITRLARHFDAVATVKKGKLIFLTINNTRTSAGEELPTIHIDRTQTSSHTYTSADRDSYTGVRATYHNINTASHGSVMAGTKENVKELPDIYANKEDALKAAKSEWQRIERGVATLSLQLATGMPDLMPQSIIQVSGFKDQINSITWLVVRVAHSLGSSGLLTNLELEVCSQKTDVGDDKKGNGGGSFWK